MLDRRFLYCYTTFKWADRPAKVTVIGSSYGPASRSNERAFVARIIR